jgi:hypothetical protein
VVHQDGGAFRRQPRRAVPVARIGQRPREVEEANCIIHSPVVRGEQDGEAFHELAPLEPVRSRSHVLLRRGERHACRIDLALLQQREPRTGNGADLDVGLPHALCE